jgi:membrane-associated phospholipid phosphatase
MKFLTEFGDQAVVLPLTAVVAIMLLLLGWWRGAVGWCLAVSSTFATVLSLKIVFYACHAELPHLGIRLLGVRGVSETIRHVGRHLLLILLAALLLALVFGFSRVDLGVHTVPDVLVGGAVGIFGAIFLVLMAGAAPSGFRRWPLAAVVLIVATFLHGRELHAEETIQRMAITYWWPFIASCRHGQA